MSYEYRIFFPLAAVAQPAAPLAITAAKALAAAPAASSSSAPRPFSLFEEADFRRFHPTDAVPKGKADDEAENRADVYLFDETIPHMEVSGTHLQTHSIE